MKKLLFLLLLSSACIISASAKKVKTVTIDHPDFAFSFGEILIPQSVTLSDTATSILFRVNNGGAWGIAASSVIEANGQEFAVKSGEALTIKEAFVIERPSKEKLEQIFNMETETTPLVFDTFYYGYYAFFYNNNSHATCQVRLNFPPLPKGTKTISFRENTGNVEEFSVRGIRLDGKEYPAAVFNTRAPQVKENKSTWQTATLTVHILGDVPVEAFTENPLHILNNSPLFQGFNSQWTCAQGEGEVVGTLTAENAEPFFAFVNLMGFQENLELTPGYSDTLWIDYHAVTTGKGQQYYTTANIVKGINEYNYPKRAKAIAALEKTDKMQTLTDEELLEVPECYRSYIEGKNNEVKDMLAQLATSEAGIICEVPDVPASQVISSIVAQYPGKVVFIDLWATWCGPCKKGMKAMAPRHHEFEGHDVVWCYLTNESSPAKQWSDYVLKTPGNHYRLKSFDGTNPAIDGIPRYLIYGKDGQLFFDQTGFSEEIADELCNKIREALSK